MVVVCVRCRTPNEVPAGTPGGTWVCHHCHAFLPAAPPTSGDTSTAVGLIGGAALGSPIFGPVGAIVGADLGQALTPHPSGLRELLRGREGRRVLTSRLSRRQQGPRTSGQGGAASCPSTTRCTLSGTRDRKS